MAAPLYQAEYGEPGLSARHLPFVLAEDTRDAWMLCMRLALQEIELDPLLREPMLQSLFRTADHLRHQ